MAIASTASLSSADLLESALSLESAPCAPMEGLGLLSQTQRFAEKTHATSVTCGGKGGHVASVENGATAQMVV